MEKLIQKTNNTLAQALVIAVIGLFILIIIPIIPFLLIHSHFSNKRFKKDYRLFLERMNGARFFCYNSRKSSAGFAREVVVPGLDPSVHVVFIDGRRAQYGVDSQYISTMLYSVKERKGFPYLLKIDNAEVINTSVNNQFYNIMIGRKPIEPLLERINAFFNSTTTVSSN